LPNLLQAFVAAKDILDFGVLNHRFDFLFGPLHSLIEQPLQQDRLLLRLSESEYCPLDPSRTLQVVGNGGGSPKVVEPAGLTVSRDYDVPWKKQTLDIAELARLRFEEGLGSRQIAGRMGIPRTTAITAVHRLEKARGVKMTSFIKLVPGIALALATTGQLRSPR
jgi:predicted DNA-binding protein (UPF0251 family)